MAAAAAKPHKLEVLPARARSVRTVCPMNQNQPPRTHYEMLGVAPDSDTAAVKAMYRKLVRTMHPDVGGNSALFGLITEAKECLCDPSRRAEYDRYLAAGGTAASDPQREQALRAAQAAAAAAQRAAHDAEAGRLAAVALLRQGQARQPLNADQEARAAVQRQNAQARARVEMAQETKAREFAALRVARAGYVAERRRLHPPKLWWAMVGAVLVGLVASWNLQILANPPGVGGFAGHQGIAFFAGVATVLRAAVMLLFGGFLIARRSTLAPLGRGAAAGICAAWALVTALGGTFPAALGGRLPVPHAFPVALVFVLVVAAGVYAQEGRTGSLWRVARPTVGESLLCVWAVARAVAGGVEDVSMWVVDRFV
jgi:hypothetical protein